MVSRPGREGGQGWLSFYSAELLPHVWTGPGSDGAPVCAKRPQKAGEYKFVDLAGASHWLPEERADEIAHEICAWIAVHED